MMLTTKARYAVMAMVDLALQVDRKATPLTAIAKRQGIPLNYLEQIFAILRSKSMVTSFKGPGGGFALKDKPSAVPVLDIVLAVEEPIKMIRCSAEKTKGCMETHSRCLTHDLWEGLGDQIHAYLANVSLADICNKKIKPAA